MVGCIPFIVRGTPWLSLSIKVMNLAKEWESPVNILFIKAMLIYFTTAYFRCQFCVLVPMTGDNV